MRLPSPCPHADRLRLPALTPSLRLVAGVTSAGPSYARREDRPESPPAAAVLRPFLPVEEPALHDPRVDLRALLARRGHVQPFP